MSSPSKTIHSLNLFKLVGAFLVVIVHLKPFNDTGKPLLHLINFGLQNYIGRLAVPFFFTTSGYLLYRKIDLASMDFERIKSYLIRLFWLYMIWSVIYLPVSYCVLTHTYGWSLKTVLIFFRNVLFTGSYAHLWYLPALIFSILLITFLLNRGYRPKKIVRIALFFYVLGLFAQSWHGFILPLKDIAPNVWHFFTIIGKVIVTTRNGLFDGFLFVSLGMQFAFSPSWPSQKRSLSLFVLSMILLFFEVLFLQYFGIASEHDMYLLLVPSTAFLFCFIVQLNLSDRLAFQIMRPLSSLIYFSHLWIYEIIVLFICKIPGTSGHILNTQFSLTLLLALCFSLVIVSLQKRPGFHWLKKIY